MLLRLFILELTCSSVISSNQSMFAFDKFPQIQKQFRLKVHRNDNLYERWKSTCCIRNDSSSTQDLFIIGLKRFIGFHISQRLIDWKSFWEIPENCSPCNKLRTDATLESKHSRSTSNYCLTSDIYDCENSDLSDFNLKTFNNSS